MSIRISVAILASVWSLMGHAADNSCFFKVRDSTLAHAKEIPALVTAITDGSKNDWTARPIENEEFFRIRHYTSESTELHYRFVVRHGRYSIVTEIGFSPPDKGTDNLLSVTRSYNVFRGDQLKILAKSEILSYKAGCVEVLSSEKISDFTPKGSDQIHVVTERRGVGHANGQQVQDVDRMAMENVNLLDSSRTARDLRRTRLFGGAEFPMIHDTASGPDEFESGMSRMVDSPPLIRLNQLNKRWEFMEGVDRQTIGALVVRMVDSPVNTYWYYELLKSDNPILAGETLSKEDWLKRTPIASTGGPKVIGFQKDDFSADSLRYSVRGNGPTPTPFNYSQYFDAELSSNAGEWRWTIIDSGISLAQLQSLGKHPSLLRMRNI
jgi:hypothetical protein